MQTAAAYIRVSTDDQLEYSPDSQLDLLREYAKTHDLLLPDENVFREAEGVSGRKADRRPEFQRMIAMAKKKPRPFDVILVWKFSRFARNREDSIVYKSMLKKQCSIDVISISEPVGDDKVSIITEAIIEAMDEYYSLNLSEEVRRGMQKKFETGGVVSQAPFGYRVENGQYTPDPKTAPLVAEIFDLFLSGHGYIEIARMMNERGVRTKYGNLWENRTVEYLIRNPVYAGKLRFSKKGRIRRDYGNENMQVVDGKHPAIVSQELFEAAQLRVYQLKEMHPYHGRTAAKYEYMLRGLAKCSNCGRTLSASAGKVMQCIGYTHGKCNVSHYISIPSLDLLTLQTARQYLESGGFRLNIRRAHQADTTAVELDIARHNDMLKRARDAYISGADTLAEYTETKHRLSAEIERLRDKLPKNEPIDEEAVREAFRRSALSTLDEIGRTQNPKTRNDLLKSICEKVVFSRIDGTVDVYFFAVV